MDVATQRCHLQSLAAPRAERGIDELAAEARQARENPSPSMLKDS
jgi:hypothetical protein